MFNRNRSNLFEHKIMTKCNNCKEYQDEIKSLQVTLNTLEFRIIELEKDIESKKQQIRKLKQK